MTTPLDYRAAGVDIAAADDAKRRIQALVESTRTAGALGDFGSFGGLFRAPAGERPVLVASADGVGTKIKLAVESRRYDTVGHDLVNHCVNDILAQGATPLFFLDYVAFGALDPRVAEGIVAGVAAGCRENGCALIGGETAEMPGLYTPPDFDLAGFIVGVVEEDALLGRDRVRPGDRLVALESSGLHTNGYSLARRIVGERLHLGAGDPFPGAGGATVADVLLRVHRSYLAALRPVLRRMHALAHITGGGIPGNLNRVLSDSLDAVVQRDSWTVPDVFRVLAEAGEVTDEEMFRAFNMGVGALVVVAPDDAPAVIGGARAAGVPAWLAGEIVAGTGQVHLARG
ncbi:MAG TPA: phosphoribosylformylglycinamidine cyclo-ligase [Gemmatimonadaceae bacterium]|nr:phosphoribosylformylglycinamidine cyclo-ligase [Gemmatimonadaceae bacterium]